MLRPRDGDGAELKEIRIKDQTTEKYTIQRLQIFTQYLVSVQVFNPEGLGPATTVVVMTDEGGNESRGREGRRGGRVSCLLIEPPRRNQLFCFSFLLLPPPTWRPVTFVSQAMKLEFAQKFSTINSLWLLNIMAMNSSS